MVQRVSDPSSGVAHPVFFPAGRLDPVVTLTRGIDMYLIEPFPRPQFSRGPWPQLLPLRGPSSRLRCAISPSNRARAPAERRPDRMLRAARHDSRQSIRTTRARPPTPGSARRRAAWHRGAERANRRPAAHRQDPARRPDRSPTRGDGPPRRPRGSTSRRVAFPMTHGAARPSRAPARGSGSVTRQEQ